MDMPMSYYFSITYEDLLFKGVDIKTAWGMLSLCLGILCMSMLSEGFKVARSLLLKVATSQPVNNNTMKTHRNLDKHEDLLYWRRVRFHLLQSVLHVFHLTIGYFLMLLVMTYNAYFTIAVVLGAGFGYYCFSIFDFSGKVLGLTKLSPKRTSRKIEDNGSNRGASQGNAVHDSDFAASNPLCGIPSVGSVSVPDASSADALPPSSWSVVDCQQTSNFVTDVETHVGSLCERSSGVGSAAGDIDCEIDYASSSVEMDDTRQLLQQNTVEVQVHMNC
ncbi:uncharacterized protein LOC143027235 isoform X1 [Oratosquilla oratoria]|uniref:uncharacterized protein LOC143027235 isoform X1 n=1 Tax=Oratosquilla oratoria TaxID=337810 RepID=UPI003F75E150